MSEYVSVLLIENSNLDPLSNPHFICNFNPQWKSFPIHFTTPCKSVLTDSLSQTTGSYQFIYLTCQIIKEFEAKKKPGKWITVQNGESHLLLLTEYSWTWDKKIPFVGNSHSAPLQRNQLTEQVSLWVNREIMLLWWRWAKICVTGYCDCVNMVICVTWKMVLGWWCTTQW